MISTKARIFNEEMRKYISSDLSKDAEYRSDRHFNMLRWLSYLGAYDPHTHAEHELTTKQVFTLIIKEEKKKKGKKKNSDRVIEKRIEKRHTSQEVAFAHWYMPMIISEKSLSLFAACNSYLLYDYDSLKNHFKKETGEDLPESCSAIAKNLFASNKKKRAKENGNILVLLNTRCIYRTQPKEWQVFFTKVLERYHHITNHEMTSMWSLLVGEGELRGDKKSMADNIEVFIRLFSKEIDLYPEATNDTLIDLESLKSKIVSTTNKDTLKGIKELVGKKTGNTSKWERYIENVFTISNQDNKIAQKKDQIVFKHLKDALTSSIESKNNWLSDHDLESLEFRDKFIRALEKDVGFSLKGEFTENGFYPDVWANHRRSNQGEAEGVFLKNILGKFLSWYCQSVTKTVGMIGSGKHTAISDYHNLMLQLETLQSKISISNTLKSKLDKAIAKYKATIVANKEGTSWLQYGAIKGLKSYFAEIKKSKKLPENVGNSLQELDEEKGEITQRTGVDENLIKEVFGVISFDELDEARTYLTLCQRIDEVYQDINGIQWHDTKWGGDRPQNGYFGKQNTPGLLFFSQETTDSIKQYIPSKDLEFLDRLKQAHKLRNSKIHFQASAELYLIDEDNRKISKHKFMLYNRKLLADIVIAAIVNEVDVDNVKKWNSFVNNFTKEIAMTPQLKKRKVKYLKRNDSKPFESHYLQLSLDSSDVPLKKDKEVDYTHFLAVDINFPEIWNTHLFIDEHDGFVKLKNDKYLSWELPQRIEVKQKHRGLKEVDVLVGENGKDLEEKVSIISGYKLSKMALSIKGQCFSHSRRIRNRQQAMDTVFRAFEVVNSNANVLEKMYVVRLCLKLLRQIQNFDKNSKEEVFDPIESHRDELVGHLKSYINTVYVGLVGPMTEYSSRGCLSYYKMQLFQELKDCCNTIFSVSNDTEFDELRSELYDKINSMVRERCRVIAKALVDKVLLLKSVYGDGVALVIEDIKLTTNKTQDRRLNKSVTLNSSSTLVDDIETCCAHWGVKLLKINPYNTSRCSLTDFDNDKILNAWRRVSKKEESSNLDKDIKRLEDPESEDKDIILKRNFLSQHFGDDCKNAEHLLIPNNYGKWFNVTDLPYKEHLESHQYGELILTRCDAHATLNIGLCGYNLLESNK